VDWFQGLQIPLKGGARNGDVMCEVRVELLILRTLMTNQEAPKQFDSRRIFISENDKHFQIASFKQHKDGSMYCSWPDFMNTEWLVLIKNQEGNLELKKIDSKESGKLSIHGSGMCAFRSNDNTENRPLIIKGNKLLDLEKKESGARHLLTAFPREPYFLPISPAFNRSSDYSISTSRLRPFAIIFFAIPQTQKDLQVTFQSNFHIDDIESIPPEMGWGAMRLKFHDVFWLVYRTKHMEKWPKKSQVIYGDGFVVPFFIGTGAGQFRLELKMPEYKLEENCLTVTV
jgi:hypothetical protein